MIESPNYSKFKPVSEISPRLAARRQIAAAVPVLVTLLAFASASLVGVAPACAKKKKRKKRSPPLLTLELYKGKAKLGTELLRKKSFEEITNYSTTAKIRDGRRRYTQRTHTKLGADGKVLAYNRWVDVKGMSTRNIVFPAAGKWKQRRGNTTEGGFKLFELGVEGSIVLLEERSPTLASVAVDRAAGAKVSFVRVDTHTAGPLTVVAERLREPASGKEFTRHTLTGKDLKITVLRDADGKTVKVTGPGAISGIAKGFKPPAKLEPMAPAPAAPAPIAKEVSPTAPASAKPAPPAPPVSKN